MSRARLERTNMRLSRNTKPKETGRQRTAAQRSSQTGDDSGVSHNLVKEWDYEAKSNRCVQADTDLSSASYRFGFGLAARILLIFEAGRQLLYPKRRSQCKSNFYSSSVFGKGCGSANPLMGGTCRTWKGTGFKISSPTSLAANQRT